MPLPTVHRGGTPQDDLVNSLADACAKLREASEALAKTRPNGRDYIGRDSDFKLAEVQWRTRIKRIDMMADNMEEAAFSISQLEL